MNKIQIIILVALLTILVLLGLLVYKTAPNAPENIKKNSSTTSTQVATQQQNNTQNPTPTSNVTATPTQTTTPTQAPTPTGSTSTTNAAGWVSADLSTGTLDANKHKITANGAEVYSTSNVIQKFAVTDKYVFVIEQDASNLSHYYFKRKIINGHTSVFWHFISSYVMEDFLINPDEYGTTKTFYLLYSKSGKVMSQKIVSYSVIKQLVKPANFSSIKQFVMQDNGKVKAILQGGTDSEIEFDFDSSNSASLLVPAKVSTSLCWF